MADSGDRKQAQQRAERALKHLNSGFDELFNLGGVFDDPDIAAALGLMVQVRQHVDRYIEHFKSGKEFER